MSRPFPPGGTPDFHRGGFRISTEGVRGDSRISTEGGMARQPAPERYSLADRSVVLTYRKIRQLY